MTLPTSSSADRTHEMNLATTLDDPAAEAAVAAPARGGRLKWLGVAFSVAILAAILFALRRLDLGRVVASVPSDPRFWLIFCLYYATPIAGDWIIYHRLWRLPAAGLKALAGKLVSNELLLGYSGEAYFLAWASRNLRTGGSRFGIVKDVSILSALAGNGLTLLLVLAFWPLLRASPLDHRMLDWAVLFVAFISFAAALVQWRFLTLSRRDLVFVAAIQLARIGATTGLGILLWHFALPTAPLHWLLVLAAFRLLISRAPFLPNKDLAFAGFAVVLLGGQAPLAAAIAMVAAVLLLAHILVGGTLALLDLAHIRRSD